MNRRYVPAFLVLLLQSTTPSCGGTSCSKDTDCKLYGICVDGKCVPISSPDASTDVTVDSEAGQETQVDLLDTLPDFLPEVEMDIPDAAPEVEEDLPPATVIWTEDFSEGASRWVTQLGEWSVAGGEYVQGLESSGQSEAWVPAESWGDFALEASLAADSTDTTAVRSALGVLFRVQSIERNYYYLCEIDYNQRELVLVIYNQDVPPGYQTLCESSTLDPAPFVATWYKLQAIVSGSSLTCRWVEGETALVSVSAHDDTYAAGSIGLFTSKAAGRFDNITIYDHRPPEWPPALRSETCP